MESCGESCVGSVGSPDVSALEVVSVPAARALKFPIDSKVYVVNFSGRSWGYGEKPGVVTGAYWPETKYPRMPELRYLVRMLVGGGGKHKVMPFMEEHLFLTVGEARLEARRRQRVLHVERGERIPADLFEPDQVGAIGVSSAMRADVSVNLPAGAPPVEGVATVALPESGVVTVTG